MKRVGGSLGARGPHIGNQLNKYTTSYEYTQDANPHDQQSCRYPEQQDGTV